MAHQAPPPVLSACGRRASALQLAAAGFDRDGLLRQAGALRTLEAKLRAELAASEASRLAPDLQALTEAEGFALRPGPRQQISPVVFDTLRYTVKAHRKVRIDYRYCGSGRTATASTFEGPRRPAAPSDFDAALIYL